jgi:hypothetical protein
VREPEGNGTPLPGKSSERPWSKHREPDIRNVEAEGSSPFTSTKRCHPPQGRDHPSATSMGPPRPPFVPADRDAGGPAAVVSTVGLAPCPAMLVPG